jgi:hypothetical protein
MNLHDLPAAEKPLGHADLVPQAILREDLRRLARRTGLKLEEGSDDLDEFVGAYLQVGALPVAIKHYRGHPKGTSTIYLPSEVSDVSEITTYKG